MAPNYSTFDLSAAGVTLTAGQSYFVTFTTDTPSSSIARYLAPPAGKPAHAFGNAAITSPDGGANWSSFPYGGEIGLTVRVAPAAVLLPASAAMGTALLAVMAAARRPRCA